MDRLGALTAFVQAAETRSFVAAGRQLGVSASAIGKAVARLEERLGVRLFHRSTRSITLTPEGTQFLERCRRIFAEVEAAEQELCATQASARGKLRISLPLVDDFLLPTIAQFMRAYPEIELDIDSTDRLVDVIEEGFDAVVRTGDPHDSRLMTRRLGSFRKCLVGSPDYFRRRGVPHQPEDLTDHSCLLHRFPTTGKIEPWPLRRGRKKLEIALPNSLIASTQGPQIHLAEQGFGIACLPDFAVRKQVKAGILRSVLDDYVQYNGSFRVLWPASRYPSPKLRAFIDFLGAHLPLVGKH